MINHSAHDNAYVQRLNKEHSTMLDHYDTQYAEVLQGDGESTQDSSCKQLINQLRNRRL